MSQSSPFKEICRIAFVSEGKAGVFQYASSSDSSSVTSWGAANYSPVSGSMNLAHILLSLSGFPSWSLIGLKPKPFIFIFVPPIEGPEWGVYADT